MDARLLEARRLLRDDFKFYAPRILKLRTKDSKIVPFKFNPAQEKLHAKVQDQLRRKGRVRLVILKARQQGFSTYVGGRMYFGISQRTAAKGLVLAHKADSTANLFSMVKRYHESSPDALRPSTKYANKRELTFDKLDSAYSVATAGGDAVARGDTFSHLHASEMAFWQKSSANEIWSGLTDCIPNADGTEIYVESTANGVSGLFYEMWQKAVAGESDYEAFFSPWFDSPEYRAEPPEGFERTPEEEDLAGRYPLDDAQLYWRRLKIAEKQDKDLFRQEYPSCPEEAFLTTGRPVFPSEDLARQLEAIRQDPAPRRMALGLTQETWEGDRRGELLVYEKPRNNKSYVIGADVSMGVKGGDWSVAQVLADDGKLVASWRGHPLADGFATVLDRLGHWYNMAELVVENNNHGLLTCHQLQKVLNYPFLHQSTRYDKTTDEETQVVGFSTNAKTKPLIIDRLRSAFRKGELDIRDAQTLRELQTYIVTGAGKMEAEAGCHDDCVMALALAYHGIGSLAPPVAVTDDWYAEAL